MIRRCSMASILTAENRAPFFFVSIELMAHFCSLTLCFPPLSSATKAGGSGSSSGSSSSPAPSASPSQGSSLSAQLCDPQHKDSLLREFRKLCAMVAEINSYNSKTQIIEKFLRKGSGGGGCVRSWSMGPDHWLVWRVSARS